MKTNHQTFEPATVSSELVELDDLSLSQVAGGSSSDIHFTKYIDKPTPVLAK